MDMEKQQPGEAAGSDREGDGMYRWLITKTSCRRACWTDAATAFDANGNLKSSTISYIREGDGVDTLAQVVKTEKSKISWVYVTIEYTNTGSDTLTDIMYNGSIQLLESKGDQASVWHRELETPAAGDEWDYVVEEGLMLTAEVGAYDVQAVSGVITTSTH